ncbi:hypothetical protein FQN55_003294, partial [Onygenales sp. PD_40]
KIQLRGHNELRKQAEGLVVPIQIIKNVLMGQLFMKEDKVKNSNWEDVNAALQCIMDGEDSDEESENDYL